MKRIVLLLIVIFALALSVSAQTPEKPFNLYLAGGGTMPMDDLKDGWTTGFHGEGGIGMALMSNLELVGRVSYHYFPIDDEGELWGGEADFDGGEFTSLMYGVEAKLNLGTPASSTRPYLLGGFGWAKLEMKEITYDGMEPGEEGTQASETEMYYTVGGGIEFGTFFIQARYVRVTIDNEGLDGDADINYVPITVGFRL